MHKNINNEANMNKSNSSNRSQNQVCYTTSNLEYNYDFN